jgi:hypothetical protein
VFNKGTVTFTTFHTGKIFNFFSFKKFGWL